MDASDARVLEIGDLQYIKEAFPDRTTLLWTERKPPVFWVEQPSRTLAPSEYLDCTPGNFMRSMRDARAGRYDLVVAYLPLYSPWHPRYGLRSLMGDPLRPWRALTRPFGVNWLRYVDCPVPLVVADFNDSRAGTSAEFDVLIKDVREATKAEMKPSCAKG